MKTVSLVVLSIFFMTMQVSLTELKTLGGRPIDAGLPDVTVYAEHAFYGKLLYSLVKPVDLVEMWFTLDQWSDFIYSHPGGTFSISNTMPRMFSYQDCDLQILGDFFYVVDYYHLGNITRREILEFSAAILDSVEYREDYFPNYDIHELLPEENITCTTHRLEATFRYSLSDFKELWYIYLVGIALALLMDFKKKISHKMRSQAGEAKVYGINKNRNIMIIKKFKHNVGLSMMWLHQYQVRFVYPSLIKRLKKARDILKSKKPAMIKKLKNTRSQVIKYFLNTKKKGTWNVMIRLTMCALKTKKMRAHVKSFLQKKEKTKMKIFGKSLKYAKMKQKKATYINKLIEESLKNLFLKSLESFKVCENKRASRIGKYLVSIGFFNEQRIKFIKEEKPKCRVAESMYSKLEEVFFKKVSYYVFLRMVKNKAYKKVKKHNDQFQRLINDNSHLKLQQLIMLYNGAMEYVSQKKNKKNKEIFPQNSKILKRIQNAWIQPISVSKKKKPIKF